MVKVEQNMLVLDSSFTKEDVKAINHFIELAEKRAEDRIIKLLEEMAKTTFPGDLWHINPFDYAIALIKGEK